MMRNALIALVMVTSITGTSVASVSVGDSNIRLSLATEKPVPLKIETVKPNFKLALNTKTSQPVRVVRIKQVKIKLGKSNDQIQREREKLAQERKIGSYVDPRPVNYTIPSDVAYRTWLKAAAAKYGVSDQVYALYRVMMGESGGNPYAYNASGASGLFQFIPSTWRGTPYGGCSIWDPKSQCYAAAWMFSQGRQREWVVYNMYF